MALPRRMHGWRNVSPQDSSAAASESEPLLRTSAAAAPAAGHKAQQLAWQDVEQGQATAAAAQQASEAKGLLRTAIVVATCLAWVCVSSVSLVCSAMRQSGHDASRCQRMQSRRSHNRVSVI